MGSERTTTGWAARDSSGHLSPYTYPLRETGADDVFVKVTCCGICHTDLHQVKNDLGASKYPMVPGHEVVGEVVEVNSAVTRFVAGVTMYSPMSHLGLKRARLRGGILSLRGVGHMGHHVTVISSSDKKRVEALDHLGADEYLVSSDTTRMQEFADSLDYIIDTVPVAHPLEPYISLLALDGKLVLVGVINTPLQFISTMLMIGSMTGTEEMLEFCREKGLSSMIEVVKMDYVNTAMDRLEKNDVRYRYRFVVDVAGSKLEA